MSSSTVVTAALRLRPSPPPASRIEGVSIRRAAPMPYQARKAAPAKASPTNSPAEALTRLPMPAAPARGKSDGGASRAMGLYGAYEADKAPERLEYPSPRPSRLGSAPIETQEAMRLCESGKYRFGNIRTFPILCKSKAHLARMSVGNSQGARLPRAQIAHGYYDIQTTYSVLNLLEQARDIEQEAVDAHGARVAHGLEPQTQAELALTHRLELDQQINSAKTRVATLHEMLRALIGSGPDELGAMSTLPLPASAGGVPSSLGFELLARRPDLQAMRWYIQASLDQVEAAKAAFYPSFDIRAFAGFDSLHLEHLLQRSSRQINLIPGLSLPIFDSGRLNANLAVARSQSNVMIAQYNQSVLNAVREVAQAGLELDGLNRQASMQQAKVKAATVSFDSAEAHGRRGLLDEASAMEAKLPVLREQARMLELRSRQIHAGIALTTALGGGYDAREVDPAPLATVK